MPVSAPPRVRDRLRRCPDGPVPVLHTGPAATYVDVGGWAVGVVTPAATRVPCALRLAGHRACGPTDFASEGIPGGPVTAYLEGGSLHLGGHRLPMGRSVDVRAPRGVPRRCTRTTANSVTVLATPPAAVAEFVSIHLPRRLDATAADQLLGRGPGLTPLGDDVLAGWLAVHRLVGVATPEVDEVLAGARARTTLVSATLLDCAAHGEVVPEFARWLAALATSDARRCLDALLTVGATSGAGLAVGAAVALTTLDRRQP